MTRTWLVHRASCVRSALVALAMTAPASAFAQPEQASPPDPGSTVESPSPAPQRDAEGAADETTGVARRGDGGDRVLGDHVFIYPAFFDSSFVNTYFGVRARVGLIRVSDIPTDAGRLHIYAASADEVIDLGIKITRWLGVFGTAGIRTLIGTNLKSLAYAGATYELASGGGVLVRLYQDDDRGTQLSIRGSVSHANGQVSTLLPILQNPAGSVGEALSGDLGEVTRTPVTVFSCRGALAFAQSFSPILSVQAALGIGATEVTLEPYDFTRRARSSVSARGVTYTLGLAPAADFRSLGVPIAVMPEYVLLRQASSTDLRVSTSFDTQHLLGLGLYYSGRATLQLGIVAATQLGGEPVVTSMGRSARPQQHLGQFILRYVW